MKTRVIYLTAAILSLLIGCKGSEIAEPVQPPNYSGQYQTIPYQSSDAEPTVLLLLSHEGNKLTGTGNWNGITFNFAGTLIDKHALLTFELKGTNYGELIGSIDAFLGTDISLAGGYKLWNSSNILVGAIRFKIVNLK